MKYVMVVLIMMVTAALFHSPARCQVSYGQGDGIGAQGKKADKKYYMEISVSQCKLALFEKDGGNSLVPVREYKVGTAMRGLPTLPLGKGNVTRIELNPWWHPTQYTRDIYQAKGIVLPAAVPPGDPLNYMGTFKIHLSHKTQRGSIYRIHGNNDKNRIGRRVTGGCICMDNQEGTELAQMIPVGTEVNIVP